MFCFSFSIPGYGICSAIDGYSYHMLYEHRNRYDTCPAHEVRGVESEVKLQIFSCLSWVLNVENILSFSRVKIKYGGDACPHRINIVSLLGFFCSQLFQNVPALEETAWHVETAFPLTALQCQKHFSLPVQIAEPFRVLLVGKV